jgi:hypothetical protein
MRKQITDFCFLLFALVLCTRANAITIAHSYLSVTSTTVTSTTAGDAFVWILDSTTTYTAVGLSGGDSFTKKMALPTTLSSFDIQIWYDANESSGGKTSITCTPSCSSGLNAMTGFEVSGQDASTFFDKIVVCTNDADICNRNYQGGTEKDVLAYDPGFNAEAILYYSTCSASATGFTGTGATWTSSHASGGNPGADAVSSGYGALTATAAGCGNGNSVILGIKSSGASQQCSWDIGYSGYGTQVTTGNPTVSANLEQPGNLVLVTGWVLTSFSALSVNIASTDTLTQQNLGVSDSNSGETFIYGILGNTVTGASKTITATITGSHTAAQIAYVEFVPSAGCTMSLDATSSVSNPTTGSTANTPSITATAGALEVMFTSPGGGTHLSYYSSPWQCLILPGTTGVCGWNTSYAANGYILSASGSSTANAATLTGSGGWQALANSFKLTPTSSSTPRHRAWVIQ